MIWSDCRRPHSRGTRRWTARRILLPSCCSHSATLIRHRILRCTDMGAMPVRVGFPVWDICTSDQVRRIRRLCNIRKISKSVVPESPSYFRMTEKQYHRNYYNYLYLYCFVFIFLVLKARKIRFSLF